MKPHLFRSVSLLLLILLVMGCSPQKRLARLVALHPELKAPDTLLIRDTIPLPRIQADTFLHIDSLFDTVTIEQDRLKVSILRLHDTLWLQGKCEADTIIVEKKVPVEQIVSVTPDRIDRLISRIPWFIVGLIAIVSLIIFLLIRFR